MVSCSGDTRARGGALLIDLTWKDAHSVDTYIPIEKCRDGWLYHIAARNATLGIYREKEIGFEIRREKFGAVFSFVEYHWDVGSVQPDMKQFGTAVPIEEIERAPVFEDEASFIEYMEKKYHALSGTFSKDI